MPRALQGANRRARLFLRSQLSLQNGNFSAALIASRAARPPACKSLRTLISANQIVAAERRFFCCANCWPRRRPSGARIALRAYLREAGCDGLSLQNRDFSAALIAGRAAHPPALKSLCVLISENRAFPAEWDFSVVLIAGSAAGFPAPGSLRARISAKQAVTAEPGLSTQRPSDWLRVAQCSDIEQEIRSELS